MIILGLNAFHGDSAAALVRDGELVAAAEEERFRRIKHWAGFPVAGDRLLPAGSGPCARRCRPCRRQSGQPGQFLPEASPIWSTQRPSFGWCSTASRTGERARASTELLAASFPGEHFRGEVHQIEHHLAHLSSAFHVSPFDEAVVVSVDGFGDFASAAWGVGKGSDISDRRPRVFSRIRSASSIRR